MRESELQARILFHLQQQPHLFVFKVITANRRGIPDIIACYRGHYIAIEVKAPQTRGTARRRLTPLQEHTLELIRAAGGRTLVTRSFPGFLENFGNILREIDSSFTFTGYNSNIIARDES